MNKKCTCKNSWCRKCLLINCQDDNCKTHTLIDKIKMKSITLNEISDLKEKEKLNVEIARLIKLTK